MSEKEKALCGKIAQLPRELQEKIMDKADGAAMALELMRERKGDANNDD